MTVEEKRIALSYYCDSCDNCEVCRLYSKCNDISPTLTPRGASNDVVEKLYAFYEKLKGEPIMNEHETQTALEATVDGTIVITRAEYAYLIAKSAKTDLLEDYVNNREYLDKDTVRAILGMLGSEESEGE
jgi:hypothetical protein